MLAAAVDLTLLTIFVLCSTQLLGKTNLRPGNKTGN
jgi:hypothetical protein